MEESWRKVPGFDGKYQISIATKEGKCKTLNFKRTGKERILSNNPNKKYGRIFWNLCKDGKPQLKQAAVWIALTYPELVQNEYFEGAVIDHINTDPLDNRPENLRWVTYKENSNNPLTKQHMKEQTAGEKNSQFGKKRSQEWKKERHEYGLNNPLIGAKPVVQYTLDGEYVDEYPSCAEVERQTALKYGWENRYREVGVSRCASGKRKTYKQFVWKYNEKEG